MPLTSEYILSQARAQVTFLPCAEFEALAARPDIAVLDVRDSAEIASGMVPGAIHAERGMLEFTLDRQSDSLLPALSGRETLIMVCGSGGRATLAAALAQSMGWQALVLEGGMKQWRAEGRATQTPPED